MATSINLHLQPGQKVTLQPVSWEGFEEILTQLGEFRASRIAYSNQILEIMAPQIIYCAFCFLYLINVLFTYAFKERFKLTVALMQRLELALA